jgi:transcriptional regulator with XRE-family HTH domain
MKPRAPVEHVDYTLWRRVGERIRLRRLHLGFSNERLACELGIDPSAYDAYEAGGELAPARTLSQISELLGVSVLWFFQDITFQEKTTETAASVPGGVYRVATLEDRMRFLSDTFRKLDLEGQQHLIAIAGALTQTSRKCPPRD